MGVTLAVVGAGRMGWLHLQAVRRLEAVRVAGVVDPSAAARERAEGQGVRSFASLEDLLREARPDGAIVAAPSPLHLELVRALARERVGVLCEKPCGLTPEEARRAGEAALLAGTVLQVGYWRRFVPALADLRRRLQAGELGAVVQVSCFQWDGRPPPAEFRRTSGGIVVDMGVHELDAIRWLTGQEVEDAAAFASWVGAADPVPEDPEAAVIALRLSGGALGLVSLGRRFPPGDACRVQVVGTDGAEEVPFLWPPEGEEALLAALRAQAEAFAAALRGEPVAGATAEDAVAALEAAHLVARAMGGLAPSGSGGRAPPDGGAVAGRRVSPRPRPPEGRPA
jgi:myo-inositol 2-dehydrogenase/D-chiro-inositol 1-dehydrogenase